MTSWVRQLPVACEAGQQIGVLLLQWQKWFVTCSKVTTTCTDIFSTHADAIISPANSFGFMDGGVDRLYSKRLGWHLQKNLQLILQCDYEGELLVGWAVFLATGHPTFPI